MISKLSLLAATALCSAELVVPAARAQSAQAPAANEPATDQQNTASTSSAPPASGQANGADTSSDVVVTGSRIPRPAVDNSQPTTTVTADTLNNRGYADVARALNELPGFSVPDSSLIGGQGNGFGVGQSFVNLYALGSQRTLTLVNGRRFVGANPATPFSQAGSGTQVDLNTIPTALIDRVETVSIGGAPIYGSDAIAGTVNIILKKNFDGIDLDGQSGISQRGDLFNTRVRALVGHNFGDRGNLTIDAEYNKDDGLLGNQRSIIRRDLGFISPLDPNSTFSQVLAENTRTFLGAPGGNPYFRDGATIRRNQSIVNSAGQYVRFGPDGNLVPFNTGTPTTDPTTFLGGDSLDFADITNLRVNDRRINLTALGNYDLTTNIHVFGEAWYSNNHATNLAGQPVYNTAFFRQAPAGSFDVNGNYIFRLDNPFLTQQARTIIAQNLIANGLPANDDSVFYVGRANTDLVSGVARGKQELYRFVGGLSGDFQVGDKKFNWEVSGNYGHTSTVSIIPSLVEPNLRRALNVTRDASGNIVCAPFNPDPNDPTQPPLVRSDPNTPPYDQQYDGTISTTCAPLNLFGNGAPSQAARDYVTTNARTDAVTTQRDFLATLAGTPFRLPGGDLGFSVGYENRREYSRFSPDEYYTTPFGRTIPILPISGSYTTNEVFGELRAPLIGRDQGFPLIDELEVNAAGRYVHNSANGGAFTWTAGGRYAPIHGIAIRGNFTKAIRAPGVTELFAANQPAFDGGYDPCDAQNLSGGSNPVVRQKNCAAAGLPTDFSSLINSVTVPINVIGNRNLSNETSNSWTVGGVLTPHLLPGFSLTIDYINIKLRDTIVASSARDVLTGCYDSTTYPENFYCSLVTRDQTPGENFGQVLTLNEPYINQGGLGFRAIETTVSYRTSLPNDLGRITANADYQHLLKQYTEISADTGRINTRGNIGSSIDKVNFNITYDSGPISWFNQIEYTGPAKFDVTEAPGTRDFMGVPSFTVWNTAVIFNVTDKFNFRINVDNVTDVGIPYPATAGAGSLNTYYQGLVGRAFLFGAGVHF